ncbi:hypothetical protein LEM8419_01130 [Neolewinella maritima]|uniref:DUF4270 family protein n=1 Tax=Neolewinella maritima TaxID=1383882 RepID=A0ABM9AYN4_9BACT|nr:DUF4270 family protein [Neolewinella maritima]CAH0999851.1 hypothetical protein LEM8419_01130 [Neolewinella maritima]
MKNVLFATTLLLVLGSCTDPITVGSELLQADRATVGEMDIPFTTRVVEDDSTLTLQGLSPVGASGYSFGQLDDPTFGTTTHSLYLSLQPPRSVTGLTILPPFVRFSSVKVDSVIMILPIDTLKAFYGPGRDFPFQVVELAEPVSASAEFYSDAELPTRGGNLAANTSFTATATPTLVRDTAITSPALLRAHVRVRMSDAFADRIDNLPASAFDTDSIFRNNLPGVLIEPDGSSDALVYLLPPQRSSDTLYRGINVHFRDTSGTQSIYRIDYRQVIPNYSYDYSGSLIETLLAQDTAQDLVALQGQSGVITELTLTDLASLTGRVVNRAVLQLPVASVAGVSYSDYSLPSRVELFYRTGDGTLTVITDRLELIRSQAGTDAIDFLIGGRLEEENGVQLYDPAFSVHLQRMIDAEVPPRIYLRVTPLLNNEIRASRVLLNGPGAAERPAKIRVTFTNID